jgi:hypothetical protein
MPPIKRKPIKIEPIEPRKANINIPNIKEFKLPKFEVPSYLPRPDVKEEKVYRDYSDINKILSPEQAMNTIVYLANLKNADRQQSAYMPDIPQPAYMRNLNLLPYNKYMISKEAQTAGVNIDRSSSNVQDRFARRLAITGEAMDKMNQATVNQMQTDAAINNTNTQISNEYRLRKADALNKYLEMKTLGENVKLANKQAAANAWLQGLMGNLASSRAYDVEKEKIQIARMNAGRGTAERSDAYLPFILRYLYGINKKEENEQENKQKRNKNSD